MFLFFVVAFLIQYGNGNVWGNFFFKVKLNSQRANKSPCYIVKCFKKKLHGKIREFSGVCFRFVLEAMKSINPISFADNTRVIAVYAMYTRKKKLFFSARWDMRIQWQINVYASHVYSIV